MSEHEYGLTWIDQDKLFDVTKANFSNVIEKAHKSEILAPPDPFATLTQAVLFNQSIESMEAFEKLRSINKTISNAVGNWHQSVLGLAPGWENLGTAGGVVDLFVTTENSKRAMAVEVKNRYNTIKASDESEVWDKLDMLARANGTTSYLIQIVPKTPERYDKPWKVSGRDLRENVRCCDGVTGYAWAFSNNSALRELYEAFPLILQDVIESVQIKGTTSSKAQLKMESRDAGFNLRGEDLVHWFYLSMPSEEQIF